MNDTSPNRLEPMFGLSLDDANNDNNENMLTGDYFSAEDQKAVKRLNPILLNCADDSMVLLCLFFPNIQNDRLYGRSVSRKSVCYV